MMKSCSNAEMMGVPPFVATTDKCDDGSLDGLFNSLQIAINQTTCERSNELAPTDKDESTADETYSESSADCSDDESDFSVESHHTNDSARYLLKQAQRRIHRQSVYDEVKTLRAEVKKYKDSFESVSRQKVDIQNRCDTLESQLAQAMDTIQSYKLKESRWNDERAERERDFMNQLSDTCSTMEANEKTLMREIIKRDMNIIELQNQWNDEEIKRVKAARERKKTSFPHCVETLEKKEISSDESWSDDLIGEFI